jgi:hypothetical protein
MSKCNIMRFTWFLMVTVNVVAQRMGTEQSDASPCGDTNRARFGE